MKLNLKDPLYIGVIVLLLVVLLKDCGGVKNIDIPKADTLRFIKYIHIHDTVQGKPKFIYEKIDTSIWMKKTQNKPDTTYKGLLTQYTSLGNLYFAKRAYSTTFPIDTIGTVTVTDTLAENTLLSSILVSNLKYPIVTKIVKEPLPPKNQLYIGTTFTGNKETFINGVYGGLLLKTKKDRLYSASIGWTGQVTYAGQLYWPLKFKK